MEHFPWFAPIERFEHALGEIEESTISLLSCLPACSIPLTAPKLPLSTRVHILLEVLPRYSGSEYCELQACLEQAASLISKRTVIADNVVSFGYQHAGANVGPDKLEGSRRYKRLSLEEVSELACAAGNLAARVASATDTVQTNCGKFQVSASDRS